MVTVKYHFNDINSWLEYHSKLFSSDEVASFALAIEIANKYYANNVFYPTKVNLLMHALTCANKVAEMHLYADAVNATILFALPKYIRDYHEILSEFSPKVLELIDGVTKVTKIRQLGSLADVENIQEKKAQVEVVRKMLLAMASDIRIVLIVLVGRSELMLHIESCNDSNMRIKIAQETLDIFAPLANRLGVWQIKWELEDLSFKCLYPEQYKKIANLLDETREDRLNYIENIKTFLAQQMRESGIKEYQVMGRAKHIYSIWRKMKKKNYDFDDLYDIQALRVLVPEVRDCYTVLGIVHTNYSPVPGEFDDYISTPKNNNYQSLHTCVIGPDNKAIEIQVRTFAMHDHAEYGIAAHWRYKELAETSNSGNNLFAEKIAWIRQILDWRDDFADRKDIASIFKNEIFNDNIYVMTPQGKVIPLPRGATPIDFAYAVHSNIGHKCRGAKVDGQIVPLSKELENGQRVEIITVKEGGPSINWLHDGLVKSSKAISHIRRFIRNQNQEEFLSTGSDIFDRELSKINSSVRPNIEHILAKLNYTNDKALQIDLGRGDLAVSKLREVLNKLIHKQISSPEISLLDESEILTDKLMHKVKANVINGILVDGVSGIVTHIAKCCKPLAVDEVVGFINQGSGVSIHRSNCLCLKRQAKQSPNKIVSITWGNHIKDAIFYADIEIIANDRSGLLRDLTELFASEKLRIDGLRTICKNNKAFMTFTLQIHGDQFSFNGLINKIHHLHGVTNAKRK